jgi:hypothetical protein
MRLRPFSARHGDRSHAGPTARVGACSQPAGSLGWREELGELVVHTSPASDGEVRRDVQQGSERVNESRLGDGTTPGTDSSAPIVPGLTA